MIVSEPACLRSMKQPVGSRRGGFGCSLRVCSGLGACLVPFCGHAKRGSNDASASPVRWRTTESQQQAIGEGKSVAENLLEALYTLARRTAGGGGQQGQRDVRGVDEEQVPRYRTRRRSRWPRWAWQSLSWRASRSRVSASSSAMPVCANPCRATRLTQCSSAHPYRHPPTKGYVRRRRRGGRLIVASDEDIVAGVAMQGIDRARASPVRSSA